MSQYYSMGEYPFDELADIDFLYDRANDSGPMAARLYQERFPHGRYSHDKIRVFAAIDDGLRDTRTFKPLAVNQGTERYVWTPDVEEPTLDNVEENPASARDK
jgi:hypothetical protein